MQNKIILIDHHDNLGDDRVAEYLKLSGFDLELYCPFKGDELPNLEKEKNIGGIVIYGGAQNLTEIDQFPFLSKEIDFVKKTLTKDIPMLGICLGAQLIAYSLGAKVSYHMQGLCEFGYYEITPSKQAGDWLPNKMLVTQAHYQQFDLPENTTRLASSNIFPNQAFRFKDNVYAVQFHPEVSPTIFKRWQTSDWAFFDQPGAQSKQQQDTLVDQADEIQGQWLSEFLLKLFGTVENAQTTRNAV